MLGRVHANACWPQQLPPTHTRQGWLLPKALSVLTNKGSCPRAASQHTQQGQPRSVPAPQPPTPAVSRPSLGHRWATAGVQSPARAGTSVQQQQSQEEATLQSLTQTSGWGTEHSRLREVGKPSDTSHTQGYASSGKGGLQPRRTSWRQQKRMGCVHGGTSSHMSNPKRVMVKVRIANAHGNGQTSL